MTNPVFSAALLMPMFSSAVMREVLDERARLQRMLDFEVALARAEGAIGSYAGAGHRSHRERRRARNATISKRLGEEAVIAGNMAIPLVAALTAEVAKADAIAARYVHWGATSQDVIDSALVLELKAAIAALFADLDRAIEGFIALAGRHRRTGTVGTDMAATRTAHAIRP